MSIKIQLRRIDEERLDILATADDAGEAQAESTMPDETLVNQLSGHDPSNFPDALMEQIGANLFNTLISGEAEDLMRVVMHDAKQAREPLRIELRFDDQEVDLARYPWEMIAENGQFFVRDGAVDMTRYITYPSAPPSFDANTLDLSLLRVVSSPRDLAPIFADDLGIAKLETLQNASFDDLSRKLLLEGPPMWSLQFDGHGGLVTQCTNCDMVNQLTVTSCTNCNTPFHDPQQVASLAFERMGRVDWVTTDDFGGILSNADIRLVLLLACDSATVGDGMLFSGLAPRLTLAGVPAVIGMQYKIADAFANAFARDFYAAMLRDGDVVSALRTARRLHSRTAWYSPVLYMRHQRDYSKPNTENPVYLPRRIDTAVPSQVQPDTFFLVKLWIRRPETAPASEEQLRTELNIPADVPVGTASGEANIKFDPVEERKLRRGKVEVRLESPVFEVTPQVRDLFIDETLDAPPAIFVLRCTQTGTFPLIFSLWQDGGQIHTAVHQIEVSAQEMPVAGLKLHSSTIDIDGDVDSRPAMVGPPGFQPPKGVDGSDVDEFDWEADTVERESPAKSDDDFRGTEPPGGGAGGGEDFTDILPEEEAFEPPPFVKSLTRLVPVVVMVVCIGAALITNPDIIGSDVPLATSEPEATQSNNETDSGNSDSGETDGRTDSGTSDSDPSPSRTPQPTSFPSPTAGPTFTSIPTWTTTPVPSPTLTPSATNDVTGPPAPQLISPEDEEAFIGEDTLILRWQPVFDPSGIKTYVIEVEYRTSTTTPWEEYDTYYTQETEIEINTRVFSYTYFRWRVQAIDGYNNDGVWSSWWHFYMSPGIF